MESGPRMAVGTGVIVGDHCLHYPLQILGHLRCRSRSSIASMIRSYERIRSDVCGCTAIGRGGTLGGRCGCRLISVGEASKSSKSHQSDLAMDSHCYVIAVSSPCLISTEWLDPSPAPESILGSRCLS